jgi:hypothetical protein
VTRIDTASHIAATQSRHQSRLGHQAGAERAALHALARAAAVQVDLVVAPARAQARACGQVGRIAAAQLQCDRVLAGVEIEVSRWLPWISAPVVTISVYSRALRVSRRWKKRQCRSVQSSIGATQKRQGSSIRIVYSPALHALV